MLKHTLLIFLLLASFSLSISGQEYYSKYQSSSRVLQFVSTELDAYMGQIQDPDTLPERMFDVPIGSPSHALSLMEALGNYYQLASSIDRPRYSKQELDYQHIGGMDTRDWIIELGARFAPTAETFDQVNLVSMMALPVFRQGEKLEKNVLWQRMDAPQRKVWKNAIEEYTRWYNPQPPLTREDIGGRPYNYYGLAFHHLALARYTGFDIEDKVLNQTKKVVLSILQRHEGYMDDLGAGVYDRYLHEFIRFTYQGADLLGDEQLKKKLKPFARKAAQLWWTQYNPRKGHSYFYGRSLQNVWDDTFEQVAFFFTYPELAPASATQLVNAYHKAFDYYLSHEYNSSMHRNRMREEGRGTYGYARIGRVWDYSTGTMAKMCKSAYDLQHHFEKNVGGNAVKKLSYHGPDTTVLFYFRKEKNQQMGVWVYNKPSGYVTLPFFVPKLSSDYAMVPYRLPGIEYPVNEDSAFMLPKIQLANGSKMRPGAVPKKLELLKNQQGVRYTADSVLLNGKRSGLASCEAEFSVKDKTYQSEITIRKEGSIGFQSLQFRIPLSWEQVQLQGENLIFSTKGQEGVLHLQLSDGHGRKLNLLKNLRWKVNPNAANYYKGPFEVIRQVVIAEAEGEIVNNTDMLQLRITIEYR